jgi:hypothetical protein
MSGFGGEDEGSVLSELAIENSGEVRPARTGYRADASHTAVQASSPAAAAAISSSGAV